MHTYRWTENSIRLFRAAQEATRFPDAIAEKLLPHLDAGDAVLDAGCGLGGLSLALAPHVKSVLSLDTDGHALAVLRQDIEKNSVRNVTPVLADVFSFVPAGPVDVLVCCSFGHSDDIPPLAKRLGVKKVLWVKKDYADHRFSKGRHPIGGDDFSVCAEKLKKAGVPFSSERFCVEAGQPLKDLAEARLFFTEYGRDEDPAVYTDEFLKSRLVPSEDPRYEWYLPHGRKLALMVFRTEDLPQTFA